MYCAREERAIVMGARYKQTCKVKTNSSLYNP